MTKGKGSATAKVLRTHRQAVGWTLLLSNLFLLLLAIGGLLLRHMLQYTGGWHRLLQASFTRFQISFFENPPQIVLFLTANGMETKTVSGVMTAEGYKEFNGFNDEYVTADGKVIAPDKVTVKGKGVGHGVGFSAIGSEQLAKDGYNYKYIIGFFFNGTKLLNIK